MKKKQVTTTLKQIAQTAPVNKWFDKYEFAEATGMDLHIANTRLWMLSRKEKLISQKPGKNRSVLYFISEAQQEDMIIKGNIKRSIQGKRRKPVEQVITSSITEAEAILKKAGLM